MRTKTSRDSGGDHTVFSGALNNLNYLSGGVDPQTGFFSSVITFGTLYANRALGEDFPLKMTFSALATLGENSSYDTLLGKGWEFDLPWYNGSAGLITLPGGKTYKIYSEHWSGQNDPWSISHQGDDILIFGNEGDFDSREITIRLKSGEEFLLYCPDQYSGWIKRYTGPDGRYIYFDISDVAGGIQLNAITDSDDTTLAAMDYEKDKETHISLYPGTPCERNFVLYTNGTNNTLSRFSITVPDGDDLSTEFDYEHKDLDGDTDATISSITQVTYPSGALETITYDNRIYLPTDAPWSSFPAVSRYSIQQSGKDPVKETEYQLGVETENELGEGDQHNFFGNGININWEDATDSLANYDGDYTYSNLVIEDGSKQTTYTYNKFHQQIVQEETYDGGITKKITTSTYYGDASIPLNDPDQDVRYELENSRTVRYQDDQGNSREFVTAYEHDTYGNILRQENPDGTVEETTYYPQGGSGADCPAHPFGMVYFIKDTLQHPAPQSDDLPALAPKQLSYTYKEVAKKDVAEGAVEVFVVPATEIYDQVLTTYTYYEDDTTAAHYGLMKDKTVTANEQDTLYEYTYAPDDTAASTTITETITGHDQQQLSTWETKAYGSGQVVEEADENQIIIRYIYDAIGRVTQEIHAQGSDYEAATLWSYHSLKDLEADEKDEGTGEIGWLIRESTTASQAETHIYYTHNKEECMKFVKHHSGSFHKVSQTDFDGLGRPVKTSRFDYEFNDDDTLKSTHEQFKTSVYGIWGEVKETTDFNGALTTIAVDPFTLQSTRYVQSEGGDYFSMPRRSTYNLFKETERVELLDGFEQESEEGEGEEISVYASLQYLFDGFGRQAQSTSAGGKTTATAYDAFDRPVSITHHDQTRIDITYEDPSEDQRVAAISLTDTQETTTEMGTQTYDGLGRLKTKTVNGVSKTYEYDPQQGSTTNAWRVTNGRGQSLLFGFNPALNALAQNATSLSLEAGWDSEKESEGSFNFATAADTDYPTGSLKEASSDQGSYTYSYTATGQVASVTQNVSGQPSLTLEYQKRTLLGKPISIAISKDGQAAGQIIMTYDAHGRLHTTTQEGLTSQYGFDPLGRIQSISVYEEGQSIDNALQTTEIVYDQYHGKEKQRSVTVADQLTVIDYTYYEDSLLKERTTTIGSASLTERYSYDDKNRLQLYEVAEGYDETLLPRNEHGQPFVHQQITHNALDNLETLVTTFPNGDTNTATYSYSGVRLDSITNSLTDGDNAYPKAVTLTYDADGNLETVSSVDAGEQPLESKTFAYNAYNKVTDTDGTGYAYDCFNRLQSIGDTIFYYEENRKLMEHNAGGWLSFLAHGAVPVAEVGEEGIKLLATDASNTVFGVSMDGTPGHTTFSPQGVGVNSARTGFNGELLDTNSGGYAPGNGNRLYLPNLGVFNTMDSKSPFNKGGINSYRYCGGDPVNFADPTGEFGLIAFLVTAIVGVAVAAAAEGIHAAVSGEKFNWKGFLVDSAIAIVTAGVGTALTTTKAGAKVTASATKAMSSVVKSNKITATAAKGVKKATDSVKKTYKKGKNKVTGTKEAEISGKSAAKEPTYRQLDFDEDPAVLDKSQEGKKWAEENFAEQPGKMDKFFETTGLSYFSIASIGYKLGKAAWTGYQDRDPEAEQEETGDTQTSPVFSGETFSAFYGNEV